MSENTFTEGSQTTWVVRPDKDLEDLIPEFLRNRRNDLSEIGTALERGDFVTIRRMGHTLKGICRPYGFEYLEDLSKQLEQAAEQQDPSGVSQVAAHMQRYLDNVRVVYDS